MCEQKRFACWQLVRWPGCANDALRWRRRVRSVFVAGVATAAVAAWAVEVWLAPCGGFGGGGFNGGAWWAAASMGCMAGGCRCVGGFGDFNAVGWPGGFRGVGISRPGELRVVDSMIANSGNEDYGDRDFRRRRFGVGFWTTMTTTLVYPYGMFHVWIGLLLPVQLQLCVQTTMCYVVACANNTPPGPLPRQVSVMIVVDRR